MSENSKFNLKSFARTLQGDIEKNRIRLPTLPTISLEALVVVNDADSSMADVARIVSKDTSMAARLVRYANSPLYRGVTQVSSVKAAVTRIGFDAVKNAILSLAMRDVFSTHHPGLQARMEALWEHSVHVAAKATVLANRFNHLNKDEAMLAGLIHDVGAIPILIKAPEFPILLEKEANLDKVIQLLHMPIGKFMLSHWNFDPELISVAAEHDKLDRVAKSERVDYVDIIQVANILCHREHGTRDTSVEVEELVSFQKIGMELIDELGQDLENADAETELSTMLTLK